MSRRWAVTDGGAYRTGDRRKRGASRAGDIAFLTMRCVAGRRLDCGLLTGSALLDGGVDLAVNERKFAVLDPQGHEVDECREKPRWRINFDAKPGFSLLHELPARQHFSGWRAPRDLRLARIHPPLCGAGQGVVDE